MYLLMLLDVRIEFKNLQGLLNYFLHLFLKNYYNVIYYKHFDVDLVNLFFFSIPHLLQINLFIVLSSNYFHLVFYLYLNLHHLINFYSFLFVVLGFVVLLLILLVLLKIVVVVDVELFIFYFHLMIVLMIHLFLMEVFHFLNLLLDHLILVLQTIYEHIYHIQIFLSHSMKNLGLVFYTLSISYLFIIELYCA